MEALKARYEQNRAEVLKHLDVSSDLLEVMTRHGLIDIADCVKYQGIYDAKKRNGSLMKTMVERRTERAYPLFIQSLRQAGQDGVANLLTDIGEETRILTHLQSDLEHQMGAISDYIKQSEKRTGVTPARTGGKAGGGGKNGGGEICDKNDHTTKAVSNNNSNNKGNKKTSFSPPPPAPTSDREVWIGVQSSLKRASAQFERCRAVMDKLHEDCQQLAAANGDMVSQTRACYSRVKHMLKPGAALASGGQIVEMPKTTQAMFQGLIDDVQKLMNRKSQAQQEENEGRTNAMRMLRHLRDWIQERSSILDTLHTATAGGSPRISRLPMLAPRRDTLAHNGDVHAPGHPQHASPLSYPRHSSFRQQTPSPTRSNATSDGGGVGRVGAISPLTSFGEASGQGHTQGQGQGHVVVAEHMRHVEPHAISTVLEGLHLLEKQVRQYVHMEILLTDKFRAEMRYRHLRKKSFGYTSKGLDEARRILDRLESRSTSTFSHGSPNNTLTSRGDGTAGGGGDDRLYLTKLRSSLDAMCEEYQACNSYMARIAESLVRIQDVDGFLSQTDSHGQKRSKKTDKDRRNRQAAEMASSQQGKSGSSSSSVFGFFSRSKKGGSDTGRARTPPSSSPRRKADLPTITTTTGSRTDVNASTDESLLSHLKLLVANYELVRQRLTRLEDRYRRDYDHKRRAFEAKVREKDEEITQLQIRLKETEAEKDKYRGLYDKMKVSFARKR